MNILIRDQLEFNKRGHSTEISTTTTIDIFWYSRTQTWTTDTSPDTSYDNRVDMSQFRRDILFAKKVQNADCACSAD